MGTLFSWVIGLWICGFTTFARADAPYEPNLKGSSIADLIEGNGDKLPASLDEWRVLLEHTGVLSDTFVPFSDSPFYTDLDEPRLVASHSPRLFVASIPRLDGTSDFEFISFNRLKGKFDFGKREDGKLILAKRSDCTMCHRTEGPIFTDRPWVNVTGGNSPTGSQLSFAILTRLVQRDPDHYDDYKDLVANPDEHYDAIYGDLKPDAQKRLSSLRFHGFKLFQFRGSFDLDALVRQGHLLVYTHQILQATPADRRKEFIRSLLESALLSAVYQNRVDYLFRWDRALENQRLNSLGDRTLSASQSPILNNYQPIFQNEKLLKEIGVPIGLGRESPVAVFLKASEYLRKTKQSAFPDELRPTSVEPFIDFEPAENANAANALKALMGFSVKDIDAIRVHLTQRRRVLNEVLGSETLSALYQADCFPQRTAYLRALNEAIDKPANNSPPLDPDEATANRRCLRCHGKGGLFPQYEMTFLPKDTPTTKSDAVWIEEGLKSALANPATHDDARYWTEAIHRRVTRRKMPPSDSTEAQGFNLDLPEWKKLIQFLETEIKK